MKDAAMPSAEVRRVYAERVPRTHMSVGPVQCVLRVTKPQPRDGFRVKGAKKTRLGKRQFSPRNAPAMSGIYHAEPDTTSTRLSVKRIAFHPDWQDTARFRRWIPCHSEADARRYAALIFSNRILAHTFFDVERGFERTTWWVKNPPNA